MSSCEDRFEGYSEVGDEVYQNLYRFGDGEMDICTADHLELSIICGLNRDEDFDYWNDYTFQNVSAEFLGHSGLGESLCSLKENDSTSFIFPYSVFKETILDEYSVDGIPVDDTTMIRLNIAVLRLMSDEAYQAMMQEKIRLGAIKENAYLQEFIEQNNLTSQCERINDVYFMKTEEIEGDNLLAGQEIALSYQGFFLSGKEFDSSTKGNSLLYFQYGKPDQVVKGISMVLPRMSKGDKARVFVPSHLAFGQGGSSTGIVPPLTPVFFDIELVDIYLPKDSID